MRAELPAVEVEQNRFDTVCDTDDDCVDVSDPSQVDSDGDGIGDACDPCTDTDGDGYGDPGFPANTCQPDSCPEISDPGQEDNDEDGIGDACDDIDGILNPLQVTLRRAKRS